MSARMEICVDSSVIVKWFRVGEEHEREALRLRDETLSAKFTLIISEWTYLEVVRALVKANYPKTKILQAYNLLREMASLGFMEAAPLSGLLDKARDLEVDLDLYASDAVNLAVAVLYSRNMLTEDRHLLKASVKDYVKSLGLKIIRLTELFPPKF
ncbi:MAG: type II toxin-antitoxin system VapC family toxin [Candidatus Jordarchaeales archaeon]|nr:type II toxin-antitoxin system VapC family toxin [Candidatus Jordarchaeia archaeon]